MRVVIDIEANGLEPTEIWCIVCKDIDTGEYYVFRNVTKDKKEAKRFLSLSEKITCWIGHNWLGYDFPVLCNLVHGFNSDNIISISIDTYIISKLVNYSREGGHSIESYGEEFGLNKGEFSDWTKWSQEMEDYCVRDVDICLKIYLLHLQFISNPVYSHSIKTEHQFQMVVNSLHNNGFAFDTSGAKSLLAKVTEDLSKLDGEINNAFPPRLRLVREINPILTKHGTLHLKDFRWIKDGDLSEYNGGPFCRCQWETFNPSSHKQIIDILTEAGWSPEVKTKTHISNERSINKLKRQKGDKKELDISLEACYAKGQSLEKYGYKINEENLSTLPATAPPPARLLAHRILLESRRRALVEWTNLVDGDSRIHGAFYGIGAWTQRMAHQKPNTANIPNPYNNNGTPKLLGGEMRSLWRAPSNRLLVGVDAEGIQLRIFAHYIDDEEFTQALVKGKKDDKSDPHSLNQRILGNVCKSRAAAKRFIYALLLGAGLPKLAEILECGVGEAEEALSRLLRRYEGFQFLKDTIIPRDAELGYFIGLDGRRVVIPGEDVGYRKHLAMSGYLQNGEAVVMKHATLLWHNRLKDYNALLVNMVHDEWQIEVPNDEGVAREIAKMVADSLKTVGKKLKLKCPLAGSYKNDGVLTIGPNWGVTH